MAGEPWAFVEFEVGSSGLSHLDHPVDQFVKGISKEILHVLKEKEIKQVVGM